MRRAMNSCILILVAMLFFNSTVFGQNTWQITNDTEIDWVFELKPANENAKRYRLRQGVTQNLVYGEDPHTLDTWYASENPDQQVELQTLSPIYVPDLINDGVSQVSQIRSPVKVNGNQQFLTRNKKKIYAAMPGFPYDEAKYGEFLRELQESQWVGPNGETLDLARRRARRPNDRNATKLNNVQYVPGDKYYVIAEWSHDGAEGEMFLVIDPKNSNQLLGNYKYQGKWRSQAIQAQRVNGNQPPDPSGDDLAPMP